MRKTTLASLTAILVGAGLASAQGYPPGYGPPYGYPYPPQGYMVPYPAQVPVRMVPVPVAAPRALQGMPGGYAQPYSPRQGQAQATDRKPRLIGWPPAPGSIPAPPGSVAGPAGPAAGSPTAPVASQKEKSGTVDRVSAAGTLPPVRNAQGSQELRPGQERIVVLPEPAPRPVTATPASLHRNPAPACTNCGPAPMIHPAPGSPLLCEDDGCDPCNACPAPCAPVYKPFNKKPCSYHVYGRVDFLYWWVDEQESPTLFNYLTPARLVNIDAKSLDNGERTGLRSTLGFWLDPTEQLWGLEGTWLYLFPRHPSFATGGGTINRPYINSLNGQPANVAISTPGALNGTATARSTMDLWAIEGNLRRQVCGFGFGHIDVLGGFRYLSMRESLAVETLDNSPVLAGGAGQAFGIDQFDTENEFIGGQLGVEGEFQFQRWYVNPWGKCGVGVNRSFIRIAGNRVLPGPGGAPTVVSGNVLALPSNIGTDRANDIAFLPEVGVNVGIRLTNNLRFGLGYSALALINAVRPGDQVVNTVNLTQLQLPGVPPAPVQPFAPLYNGMRDSVFFAHGLNANFEFRW